MFQIRNLRKTWDDNFELKIEDLEIKRGETFLLIGPTGCGKTTLLKLLAMVASQDEGEIQLDGDPIKPSLEQRRRVTMVFQRPALLSTTVYQNITYGLQLRGEKEPLVERLVKQFGLESLVDAPAHTLSGGQMQLVAIARALAIEPDVLLLDEPTANLDPSRVAMVEDIVIADQKARGSTVIWSTHNLFQARRIADRVGFLLNGKLIEVGETETIFNTPKDSKTDDFLRGKMVY